MRAKRTYFTDEEIQIIKKYYSNMRNQDISDKYLPNKTPDQIKSKASNLGLKKDPTFLNDLKIKNIKDYNEANKKMFTEYELEIIKKYYPEGGTKIVRKYIDRSPEVIYNKANEMGIKAFSTHPDLWRVDRIMQKKDNPYSITVVYKKDGE